MILEDNTERLIQKYIGEILNKSEPCRPLWNIEKIDNGKSPVWNYIDGCMISSLIELYFQTNNNEYLDFAERFISYYVFDNGEIRGYKKEEYNIDNVSEGRVLFDLYKITGKEKYRKAIQLINSQLISQPRNEHNCFWHKLIYPNQVWLDGLYMGQVFATRYEREFNNGKDYSDIINQFNKVREFMFSSEKGLYYHGYDCTRTAFWSDKKTGCSESFWLRAEGWFAVALVDVYEYLDDGAKKERQQIATLLKELLTSLLKYASEKEGMFYQVIDKGEKKGNYLETSGSAMIAYALLKAERLRITDNTAAAGIKCFNGICEKYLRSSGSSEFSLGGICLVAGLGGEDRPHRNGKFDYYISEEVVSNDAKGLGAFIMAYTEILKIKKKQAEEKL